MWIKLLKFSREPPKVVMLSTKPSSVWREYLLRNKYGIDPLSNSMVGVEGADQAQTKTMSSTCHILWSNFYGSKSIWDDSVSASLDVAKL